MQEPLEGISFNFDFAVILSDTERASVPASIAQCFTEGDPVHKTVSRTLARRSPTPKLKLEVFFLKFDQRFAAFKRDLDEKQAATLSQLYKLNTASKASINFF